MTASSPRQTTLRIVVMLAAMMAIGGASAQDDLTADSSPIDVQVGVDTSGETTRLLFTHSRATSYVITTRDDRLMLIYADPVRLDPPSMTLEGPLVREWHQVDATRIVLSVGPGYRRFETFELRNPFRLVLDVLGKATSRTIPDTLTLHGDATVIVIDPGHGGSEIGAVGPTGLREKDVALEIARLLKRELARNSDLSVVLTRDTDRIMSLDERTAIANHNRADLFLSIHLNSSRRAEAHGAETYYLSTEATDHEARELATLENSKSASNGQAGRARDDDDRGALDLVLWDLAQNQHMAESSRLALSVQARLNALAGTRDRGVRQAPFRVLMGAMMPAILVEVGFISNADEEAKLRAQEYQRRIVTALSGAVDDFLRGREAIAP